MSAVSDYTRQAEARAPALFGRVMFLVAVTVGFATLGVLIAKDWGGSSWFIAWLLALGCLIGLNVANARGNTGLALTLLFGFGLLIGVSIAATVDFYAATDPTAVRQAFGATALTVGGLGSIGYAIRRDLSYLYRAMFWLLLAFLVAGIVLIFTRIPAANTAWAIGGIVIFGAYTVLDFNRLRHAGTESAIPIAASIFIDVLNIFLLFLRLFGGRG
ncbi:MAG TPA: Bax inhibitor-1 family protein [Conexibacter sp.]|jgi:modulator of FtsH protease